MSNDAINENKQNYLECFDFEKFPISKKEFNIKAAGVSHFNEDTQTERQLIIKDAKIGEHLMLIPELDNPYDSYAVIIKRFNGFTIGYFPSGSNKEIFDKINNRCFIDAELIEKPFFEGTYGAVLKISVYGKKL